MNPGILDKRITLEIPISGSVNQFGESIDTYMTASIWSQVNESGGNQVGVGGMVKVTANYDFLIWNYPALNEQSFIRYNGYRYKINFMEPVKKLNTRITGERVLDGS